MGRLVSDGGRRRRSRRRNELWAANRWLNTGSRRPAGSTSTISAGSLMHGGTTASVRLSSSTCGSCSLAGSRAINCPWSNASQSAARGRYRASTFGISARAECGDLLRGAECAARSPAPVRAHRARATGIPPRPADWARRSRARDATRRRLDHFRRRRPGMARGTPDGSLTYRGSTLPPLTTFRTDAGVGVTLGPFGFYVAQPLSPWTGGGGGPRFVIRLQQRF